MIFLNINNNININININNNLIVEGVKKVPKTVYQAKTKWYNPRFKYSPKNKFKIDIHKLKKVKNIKSLQSISIILLIL